MYKGTISSILDNNFKYSIRLKELPFGFINKIKNEAFVLFDNGVRKTIIEIDLDQELLYAKSQNVYLQIDIDKLKIKVNLKNIVIRKTNADYELIFSSISF